MGRRKQKKAAAAAAESARAPESAAAPTTPPAPAPATGSAPASAAAPASASATPAPASSTPTPGTPSPGTAPAPALTRTPEPLRLSPAGLALALVVLVFALYASALSGPFVFDDHEVITQNRELHGSLAQAIAYRPRRALVNATFWVNYQLPPRTSEVPDPSGSFGGTTSYHLVSVGLHALNAVLVFLLVRSLLAGPWPSGVPRTSKAWRPPPVSPGTDSLVAPHATLVAFAGAALWAVHPLQTMAVTYIAQRYALLAATGVLGSVLSYVTLRRRIEAGTAWAPNASRGSHALLAATVALFGAGCLSKENAVVTPVLLALVELTFFGRFPEGAPRPGWLEALPPALGRWALLAPALPLAGAVALFRFFQVPLAEFFPPPVSGFPTRWSYFQTEWVATLEYARLFAWPTDLAAEQAFPRLRWEVPEHAFAMAGALVVHGLIVALAVKWWLRGLRIASFAVAWVYVTLSIESSFIPIIDPFVEHRFYLPSVLVAAALAYGVARATLAALSRPSPRPDLALHVGAAWVGVVVLLGGGTVLRNRAWQSEIGLWLDTLEKRPGCARAWSSLGMQHLVRRDPLRAIEPLATSVELAHYQVEAWNNLGKAYLDVDGLLPDRGAGGASPLLALAEDSLRTAIQVNEKAPSEAVRLSWNNLGLVLLARARRAETRSSQEALQLEVEAAKDFVKALELDPRHEAAWIGLGESYGRQAERSEGAERKRLAGLALESYEHSGATRPGHRYFAAVLENQVIALGLAGRHAEAFAVAGQVRDVEQSARTLGLLADEAIAAAENRAALEAHPGALEAAPDRLEPLGDAFARAGDRVTAAKAWRAAARVAWALRQDRARAEADFKRAIDLWPPSSNERAGLEGERRALLGS